MTQLTNLLKETLAVLQRHEKLESNVLYVSYSCYQDNEEGTDNELIEEFLSWEDFKVLAQSINYDSGYGGECINLSLQVVGADFWLERTEYDGSENWNFKSLPKKPKKQSDIFETDMYKRLLADGGNEVNISSMEDTLKALKEKRMIEATISPTEASASTDKLFKI